MPSVSIVRSPTCRIPATRVRSRPPLKARPLHLARNRRKRVMFHIALRPMRPSLPTA